MYLIAFFVILDAWMTVIFQKQKTCKKIAHSNSKLYVGSEVSNPWKLRFSTQIFSLLWEGSSGKIHFYHFFDWLSKMSWWQTRFLAPNVQYIYIYIFLIFTSGYKIFSCYMKTSVNIAYYTVFVLKVVINCMIKPGQVVLSVTVVNSMENEFYSSL